MQAYQRLRLLIYKIHLMAFQKQIIVLADEGFTGETVDHIITKANLKNRPELAEKYKVGDSVLIEKPVAAPPADKNDGAKPKPSTKDKNEVVNPDPNEPGDKSSKKGNPKRAKEIADAHNVETVFENEKGEFFTSENLANLSVGNDKTKIINHNF